MTDNNRIQELLSKYYNNTASLTEAEELFKLIENNHLDEEYRQFFLANETPGDQHYNREEWNGMLQRIKSGNRSTAPVRTIVIRWIAAASVLMVLSIATYIYFNKNANHHEPSVVRSINTIGPGTNRATLTLASGEKIELSGQTEINDGNITIKNTGNELVYENTSTAVMNTMSTPRGGQYKLQLPDGSHVWLNASSSITYPTAFTGKLREVTITGEAYFEIAKNASKPFTVRTLRGIAVNVLGTSFNINAYDNEPVLQTTLIEGSVKLDNNILKPGQAWCNGKINKVNTTEVVAWKNGLFKFSAADLKTVMRQVERWYDIEVKYEGNVPNEIFKGEMERNLKLSDIMEMLSFMEIGYRLEGGKVLVIAGKK